MLKKLFLGLVGLFAFTTLSYAQVSVQVGPGPIPCAYTQCIVTGINATTLGSVTAVAYGFNSAKTGWYSGTQDASVGLSVNGTLQFDYAITTASRFTFTPSVQSNGGSSWLLTSSGASATSPSLVPNRASTSTGIGAQASGNMSFIAVGVEQARITSNGVVLAPSNVTATAWTTTGIGLVQNASTVTDSTSSGTVAEVDMNVFSAQTIAASSATTYTLAVGNVFNPPVAGTNVTIGTGFAARFNGTIRMGGNSIVTTGNINSNTGGSYSLSNVASTATVPTVIPNSVSGSTGIGGTSGNVSVIIAGTEGWRQTSTGPLAIVLPTDAATTDNSMCVNLTSHAVSSGTGVGGLCLGTSSIRFKTGIAALTPGLNEILKLKPKSFYLNKPYGDPKKQMYGFIAEDMVKVLPKLVGLDKQGRPNTADYLGVIPVLVNAVQQQQKEILSLDAENKALRASNDNFNRRLMALEHPKMSKMALK